MKKLNKNEFIWLVEQPINIYNENIVFLKSLKFLFDYSSLNNDKNVEKLANEVLVKYIRCGGFDIKNNVAGKILVSKMYTENQREVIIALSKKLEKKFNKNLKQKDVDPQLKKAYKDLLVK